MLPLLLGGWWWWGGAAISVSSTATCTRVGMLGELMLDNAHLAQIACIQACNELERGLQLVKKVGGFFAIPMECAVVQTP